MKIRLGVYLGFICFGFMILGGVWRLAWGQDSTQTAPLLRAAKVPTYPRVALLSHIQGVVKIRVTTNGKEVSSVEADSGPPMLVKAAKENVLTWEFEDHAPTTFVTVFTYSIRKPAQCDVGNSIAVLHMPQEVQISANGVKTCDPAKRIESPAAQDHP
jgi:hypothetical protein